MTASQKITQQELIAKVKDLDVSDEELAKYFILDQINSNAFSPQVIPNPDLIEDSGLEGAFALNSFNKLARWRRNAKYKRRIKNWEGVRIVAEGDSWFQYPLLLKDTIDQLIDLENFQYAIYGLSEAGDLLSNIVIEDEISEAIDRENPDIFLISGGGNDMVGNSRMATLVHKYSANRLPENYPNEKFDEFLDELERLYRKLFSRLLIARPHLKIICHGYDNAIPQNGKWLGKPLEKQNIKNKSLQQKIVAVMIGRFNQRLQSIVNDFTGSVFHVDCQNLIGDKSNWHDELHPKDTGYFQVAQKFDEAIQKALSTSTASPAMNLNATMESVLQGPIQTNIRLAKMQKLNNREFMSLVVSRAESLMDKKIAKPKNKIQRKEIEKDIQMFFEKIHKEANFLPSSFLEIGVRRAQSVCRITTDTSYGSGFLIASRNFVMTNNHVLPTKEIAKVSIAEFDYDEDTIFYSVTLNPEKLFITSKDLDFSIVACDPAPLPDNIEAIPLLRDSNTITRGERVNIIQHPRGRTKEISLHDNKVSYVYDVGIRYTADTEGGSSGSPVFNNQWDLVALHHAGWSGSDGTATNEGIRIASIVDYLVAQNDNESNKMIASLVEHVGEFNDFGADSKKNPAPAKYPTSNNASGSQKDKKGVTLNIEGSVEQITIKFD
ncbi:MAG: hypothetical protein GY705_01825 [Bacteroidetes bacterium]|nr:hypothetical protein [Bacteroidota bacterium]